LRLRRTRRILRRIATADRARRSGRQGRIARARRRRVLKNLRNNQVRSYIADNEGLFRFSGLDPNADYEVHAEKDGAKSPTRQVSSFDNRKEIVLTLKLDKKKD